MAAIFARTIIVYALVGLFMRLMGKRQIGELEISELISTFLISEIAALPIADPDIPLLNGIVPALFILIIEIIVSTVKNKSERLKRIIDGEPVYLIYKGKLFSKEMIRNRLSINELLSAARSFGIADYSEIYYAILEQNGQISVFKKDDKFSIPIVIDGEIIRSNLKLSQKREKQILSMLSEKGLSIKDVYLMTLDEQGKTSILKKEDKAWG